MSESTGRKVEVVLLKYTGKEDFTPKEKSEIKESTRRRPMKKLILVIIFLLFTVSTLSALTIDATVTENTIYEKPRTVRGSCGKLRSTGE